jgi:1-acyl-sn-glycerol-3-phosphate acyltransferase
MSERGTYKPFVVGLAATAAASAEVLVRSALGRLDEQKAERILTRWRARILRAGNMTVEVHGRENVEPRKSHVVMFNHRSHLDLPALYEAFPPPLRGVAKSELGRVPVWGPAMKKLGFVFVTRGNTKRAIQELEAAKELLKHGVSVFVAPEGTRSRDGSFLPFKKGGFHLAKDLGVPIIPVWIEGTATIMKPDSFLIYPNHHVVVRIGAPLDASGPIDETMTRVREAMLALSPDATRR